LPFWRITDRLWGVLEPILNRFFPPKNRGRRRQLRKVLQSIVYVLRSGCQWKALPIQIGSGSNAHAWHQRFSQSGCYREIWAAFVSEADRLGAVGWSQQSVDGSMCKSPLGGDATGPNPTDRGKCGTKRSSLSEEHGYPLAHVIGGANENDHLLLARTLEQTVVEPPDPTKNPMTLNADAGYDNQRSYGVIESLGFIPKVTTKEESKKFKEKRAKAKKEARKARGKKGKAKAEAKKKKKKKNGNGTKGKKRWVIERLHSWLNRNRKIKIRYEKKSENYLGLLELASIILWARRLDQVEAELKAKQAKQVRREKKAA
jgi:putative transposase